MALRIYSQKYKQISYQPSRLPLTWSFHKKNYHWQAGIQDLRCLNKRVLSQQNLVQKALALLSARMSKVSPKSNAPFYWHVLYIRDFLHAKQFHRRSSVSVRTSRGFGRDVKKWWNETMINVDNKPISWNIEKIDQTMKDHKIRLLKYSQGFRMQDILSSIYYACAAHTC